MKTKSMNHNRFVVGERVLFVNHVTGQNLGLLEVVEVHEQTVTARKFFGSAQFEFHPNGDAKWSCNLSIQKQR